MSLSRTTASVSSLPPATSGTCRVACHGSVPGGRARQRGGFEEKALRERCRFVPGDYLSANRTPVNGPGTCAAAVCDLSDSQLLRTVRFRDISCWPIPSAARAWRPARSARHSTRGIGGDGSMAGGDATFRPGGDSGPFARPRRASFAPPPARPPRATTYPTGRRRPRRRG